ncbi:MAG: efflux RND transporter periplasmic adaptor subunit [bacterium]|nr:efflux RND transporter periplasmic adaptor subunit [bacterium]
MNAKKSNRSDHVMESTGLHAGQNTGFRVPSALIKKLLVGSLAVSLLGGGAYAIAMYAGYAGSSEAGGDTSRKAGAPLYTCSMHPHVIRDEPGSCPICGMDLTPFHDHSAHADKDNQENHANHERQMSDSGDHVEGFEESDAAKQDASPAPAQSRGPTIQIQAEQIRRMGVVTEIAGRRKIARKIRSVAHIDYNESAEALMNSRVDGWVEKLYARFTGQTIKRGQALAAIYSPELVSTQEEYLQLFQRAQSLTSDAAKSEMERLLAAARGRLRNWNISPAQIRSIERSGKAQRLLTLYSPYSGVVVEKMVTEGAHVKAGTDLFKIVDLSTVWAYVHIPEKDMPFVSQGMPAEMIIPQLPGESFAGSVSFVFPFMEMESRDLKIRLSFRNPGFRLKPGMYATILLEKELQGEQLVVPTSAVIRSGTRNVAFVYHGDGEFEARVIRTGVVDGAGGVQVIEGIVEGEAVVVSGQFLLDSESRLQEVMRNMRGRDPVMPDSLDEGAKTHSHSHGAQP